MRKENVIDKSYLFERLFWHLLWGVPMWIWYRAVLFRTLPQFTLTNSRIMLLCLVVMGASIGFGIDIMKNKDSNTVFLNLLYGFGIYTILAYISIKTRLIYIVLSVSVLIVIAYIAWVSYYENNKKSEKKHKVFIEVMKGIKNIFGIGLGSIMAIMFFAIFLGGYLIKPSDIQSNVSDRNEWTVSNKISIISLFDEKEWAINKTNIDAKLNACQTLANCLQSEWGTTEMNVVASDISGSTLGCYNDREHLIVIDIDHLIDDSGPEVCNTVIHEAYHCLEHRMVDAYNAADEFLKKLELYRESAVYAKEFENYKDSDEYGYCAYAEQLCEANARVHARIKTMEILERIGEYKGGVIEYGK